MTVFNSNDRDFAEDLFERVRIETAVSGGGVTRASYSEKESAAMRHIAEAADQAGLYTSVDSCANLVMTMQSRRPSPALWIGSHLDSVPCGGNYDGLAGVVAALLILMKAKKLNVDKPLVGIGLRGEESAWFGIPHVGAKALTGKLTDLDLARCRGVDSYTLEQAMRECDVTEDALKLIKRGSPFISPESVTTWWELHIEQGPSLAKSGVPVGIVTGINGSMRAPEARMRGRAGHSGTTPHALREDAVLRFADLMCALESRRVGLMEQNRELRITCGKVATNPLKHGITSIADEVTFSLDVRGDDLMLMRDLYDFAKMYAGDDLELGELVVTKPCALSPDLYLASTVACRNLGLPHITLPSGAGHDASVFDGANIKAGMIFVRNRNGSHNPSEAMSIEDFMLGVEVLWQVVTT